MYAQIPALIGQAVQHFQLGQLEQAQTVIARALNIQPRNFDALHIQGVILATQGRRNESIEVFRKALAINKSHSFLQFNMAKALSESGDDTAALVHHKRATQLAPDHAEAWLNYGQSLRNLGRTDEACLALERAIGINPQYAAAWSNLGLALNELDKQAEALIALEKAITLQPDLAEAHNNKGLILDKMEKAEEALACFDHALKIRPNYADAWLNKGVKLGHLGRHEDALACYKRSLELNPAQEKAWNYQGSSYLELGNIVAAIASHEQAISIRPDYATAQSNLAVLLLQTGEFARGWEKFEYRWQAEDSPPQSLPTTRPLWTGDASESPLLFWGEQGIGDQILYASILPELAILARKKYVSVDKRLLPLFARSMPGFEFIDPALVCDDLDFKEHLPLGSLPRLFRPSLDSFERASRPFLLAEPDRVHHLRGEITNHGKLICGVSWASNRKGIGKDKSISLEQMLLPLASDRLHFIDLQYGDTLHEREALRTKHGINVQHVEEIDNFDDIDGLAALIQACDLIITTSNSTVHLAGALGKTSLLLLPLGKSKLWYWTEFGGSNPWYPSVHAFTQIVPGQWQHPLELLKQYIEGRTWN